jgi:hypothetical protein
VQAAEGQGGGGEGLLKCAASDGSAQACWVQAPGASTRFECKPCCWRCSPVHQHAMCNCARASRPPTQPLCVGSTGTSTAASASTGLGSGCTDKP